MSYVSEATISTVCLPNHIVIS